VLILLQNPKGLIQWKMNVFCVHFPIKQKINYVFSPYILLNC
jgi:hypothetical protein